MNKSISFYYKYLAIIFVVILATTLAFSNYSSIYDLISIAVMLILLGYSLYKYFKLRKEEKQNE